MKCDICCDSKYVRLPCTHTLGVIDDFDGDVSPETCSFKVFDCPQCVPKVPYRRVRATKVTTAYPAEQYGQYQMPIERALAARFGEYLYREGLIRFTTGGSKDFGLMEKQITVTAHLGVVTPKDAATAGAIEEVAATKPPPIPEKVRRRAGLAKTAVAWKPKPGPWEEPTEAQDEFADIEPKTALSSRFSGLEI